MLFILTVQLLVKTVSHVQLKTFLVLALSYSFYTVLNYLLSQVKNFCFSVCAYMISVGHLFRWLAWGVVNILPSSFI